jgi:RHS repeat-associated protein
VRVKDSLGYVVGDYAHDALGRRITEVHGAAQDELYYSVSWQVLEERDGSGAVQAQYVWSPVYVDALALRDRDSDGNGTLDERLYAQQDANFNVTALVNTAGQVVERYAYDPYGQVIVLAPGWTAVAGSAFSWQYLHQGGRYDDEAGLYSFRRREYSPTLGRWVSQDPLGFWAGDTNLYRYVASSPASSTDPSGLMREVLRYVSVVITGAFILHDIQEFESGRIGREEFHFRLAFNIAMLVIDLGTSNGGPPWGYAVQGGGRAAAQLLSWQARAGVALGGQAVWRALPVLPDLFTNALNQVINFAVNPANNEGAPPPPQAPAPNAPVSGSEAGAETLRQRAEQLYAARGGHADTVAAMRARNPNTGEERIFVSLQGDQQACSTAWQLSSGERRSEKRASRGRQDGKERSGG